MSEEGKKAAAEIAARLKELTEQRDELFAALVRIRDLDVNCSQQQDREAWAIAALAIARAERNR